MFPFSISIVRVTWLFFLLFSFWPWEQDPYQTKRSSLEIFGPTKLFRTLRVALHYELQEVRFGFSGPYEIKSFPAGEVLRAETAAPSLSLQFDPAGIRIGNVLYPVSALRITSKADEMLVQGRKYRSAIQVLKNPAKSLTVVNEIDVEDYLKGVLPAEMNPAWPEEALKAQAVVSRSYAVFKNIENKNFPFTLGSDVGSQVYRGKTSESASTNRAVEKTRGEILAHRGKIFPTFFHSTCGGRTTRADYQWNIEPHPSLKGVECVFCQGSRHHTWRTQFSATEIENLLAKSRHRLSRIESITPKERDASDRPRFAEIKHGGGSLTLPANEFRLALGSDRLRSTRFDVERQGNQFFFKGRGWGHGVGMCQFGAKHLAELGYRYTDILRYYYPDSNLGNLEDMPTSGIETYASSREKGEEGNVFKRWFKKAKAYLEEL